MTSLQDMNELKHEVLHERDRTPLMEREESELTMPLRMTCLEGEKYVEESNLNQAQSDIYMKLKEMNLDAEKWARKLKEDVGIETASALKYVGYEIFLSLKQDAEANEIESLKLMLRIDETLSYVQYRILCKKILKEQETELGETNKHLKECKDKGVEKRYIKRAQIHCREVLQIPQGLWITEKVDPEFACAVIDFIYKNIRDINAKNPLVFSDSDLLKEPNCTALTGVLAPSSTEVLVK